MTTPRRFFFVVFSDSGHLNPLLAVACGLAHLGHAIHVHSLGEDVAAAIARAGLQATSSRGPGGVAFARRPNESARSVELGKRLANHTWLARINASVLVQILPRQIEDLRPVIRSANPDVVVVDAMAYAGAAAATLEGVPWATLATGLQGLVDETPNVYRELAKKRDEVLASFGVELVFRESDVISPRLHAVLAIEALVPRELRSDLSFIGPAMGRTPAGDAFPFERLPVDRPIVYVAFGSLVSHPPELYRALVASMSADEAFFVLAVKDLLDTPFVAELPEHVLAVGFAPQLAVLERADVMVNHGGANSVQECLVRGRPMIVVPIVQEHRFFGRLVERAGVGIAVAPEDASPPRFREALSRLLPRDAPERARAAALGSQAGDGAARASELLGGLVS